MITAVFGLPSSQAQSVPVHLHPGINVSNMDQSIRSSDDFFRFVNGAWLDKTEIPSDRTSWGSFNELLKKADNEAIKNQVKTDSHSPGMYRAYVPIQNVDAFYDAFGIKKGDGMYIEPEKRVKIW